MLDFEHIRLDTDKLQWKVDDYIGVGYDVVDAFGVNIAYHISEWKEAKLIAEAPTMCNLLKRAFITMSKANVNEDLRLEIGECLLRIESKPPESKEDD